MRDGAPVRRDRNVPTANDAAPILAVARSVTAKTEGSSPAPVTWISADASTGRSREDRISRSMAAPSSLNPACSRSSLSVAASVVIVVSERRVGGRVCAVRRLRLRRLAQMLVVQVGMAGRRAGFAVRACLVFSLQRVLYGLYQHIQI